MRQPFSTPATPPDFVADQASNAQLLAALLSDWPDSARAVRQSERLLGPGQSLLGLLRQTQAGRFGPVDRLSKAQRRLRAAIELVLRSMYEELAERCLLSSPLQVRHFLRLWLRDHARECFVGLFLDAQHRLIRAEVLFHGSVNQTAVYPREVARRALELNAAALIVAHNHPSGATDPSAADRLLTENLKTTLRMLDIPVLDHLIVGDSDCYSFAEAGLI